MTPSVPGYGLRGPLQDNSSVLFLRQLFGDDAFYDTLDDVMQAYRQLPVAGS